MSAEAFVRWYIGDLTEERAKEILGDEEFEAFKKKAIDKAWKDYVPTALISLLAAFGIGYFIGQPQNVKKRK